MLLFFFSLLSLSLSAKLLGGSSASVATGPTMVAGLGANHARIYGSWRYMSHHLPWSSVDPDWNVSFVQSRLKELSSPFVRGWDWTLVDAEVAAARAKGLSIVLQTGEGTVESLPTITGGPFDGKRFDPVIVGPTLYSAVLTLVTYAVTSRYAPKAAMVQVENELNEAWLDSLTGERVFELWDSPWRDWDFLTSHLAALAYAARAAGAHRIVHNFHTDVPAVVHTLLDLPGFYVDAITAWSSLLDDIAIDAYPNMLDASACRANVVAQRLDAARSAAAAAQPLFVMESGVPRCGVDAATCSSYTSFTPAFAANCSADTVRAALSASDAATAMTERLAEAVKKEEEKEGEKEEEKEEEEEA